MTVIELPISRATDIPVPAEPAVRMARALAIQYWRRSQMRLRHASRPQALAVLDDSILQALACLKLHLMHAPHLEQACRHAIETAGTEILDEPSRIFALACLQTLHLQRKQVHEGLEQMLGAHLQEQPHAVFNAVRFCFDPTVAEYFTWLISEGRHRHDGPLQQLLLHLAIARPAISDAFAQAVTAWTADMPGGLAALCEWRCMRHASEAKALAAMEQGNAPHAALLALALMGSAHETASAHAQLQRMQDSDIAVALVAARDGPALATALRQGRYPEMSWHLQVYAASLTGDAPLLRQLAAHTPWDDESACRAVADATAMLTGETADLAFDMAHEASTRAACVDSLLAAVPLTGPALRLGRPRQEVVLQETAALAGAPLRSLLYAEHASRVGAAVWIDNDDLACVQALACATASVIERAAFNLSKHKP